nr:MAG TPA: hypothetical protein [Caudoviricetes sp.]DAW08307.1 MAG TPA: hypothetical protein [Caudoviricetes sp.]
MLPLSYRDFAAGNCPQNARVLPSKISSKLCDFFLTIR